MSVPGETYLLRKPGHHLEHLWIVLTHANPTTGKILVTNLTTKRAGSDLTVVIQPGEHPFVTHETVVFYLDTRWVPSVALGAAMNQHAGRKLAPCSPTLLKRIQDGIARSPLTPKDIKAWWLENQPGGGD